MKRLILLSALLVAWVGVARTWAAVDPADQFLNAYLLVQEGDAAERQSAWTNANAKYTAALSILSEISTNNPDWNPHIIEFRTKYCVDHLNSLKDKPVAPAPAPGAPTPTPVPTPAPVTAAPAPTPAPTPAIVTPQVTSKPTPAGAAVTPSAEMERVQRLTGELQRAQDKIRELEAARTDLKSKLDEALAKPAPVAPVPVPVVAALDTRVADLTKQNQELSTQLATALAQTAHLKEKLQAAETPVTAVTPAAPAAPAAPAESPELNQLRAELQRAQDKTRELEATRTDLKSKLDEALAKPAPVAPVPVPVVAAPDTRVADLTKQNQELSTQLATAQAQVANLKEKLQVAVKPAAPVVAAGVESPELKQLRAEIQRVKDELATARKNLDDLANEKSALDQRYQSVSARLAETEEKLRTAKPGTETDELVLVKKQLEQSQQRLADMQQTLETARADAMRAQRAADEAAARIGDTERQLRAVKTASAKNEEVIQQLRDENAILREVRQNFGPRRIEEGNMSQPVSELKGWRPRSRQPQGAKPAGGAAVTSASNQGKVSATIPAPTKPAPAQGSGWWLWRKSPMTNAVTSAKQTPKRSGSPWWWPFGKKTVAVETNQPPVGTAPAAAVTN